MAITAADADFDTALINAGVGTTTHALAIPTNIAVGDLLLTGSDERDGGSTISSIVGSVSGIWDHASPISTSTGAGGGDSRWWFKISTAAGADTVTITYSDARVARMFVGRCPVTGNTPTLDQVDAAPATGSSTAPASDAVLPGGDGLAFGFLALSGDQDITAVAANETDVTNETGGAHLLTEAASNGVSVSFGALTIDGSRDWAFHIATFIQAGAGGGTVAGRPALTLLGVG